jgi:tripartite-type tricarboxylate transporter receptor subunit TctC
VKYDSKKLKWLARASFDDYMVTVGKSSPYQSLDSIKKAPRFKIGLDSRTATNGAGATAFCLSANLENVNLVVGYAGSSEVRLAILKGEVDGTSGSVSTQLRLLQSGDLIPISVVGFKRCRFFPEIPTVYEQNPKMLPESKKWVDTFITLTGLGRGLITSPGVPEDKTNFLRDIIKRTLSDPELIQKVEKAGFTVDYLSGGDYMKEIESLMLNPEEKVKLKYLLMEKYPG